MLMLRMHQNNCRSAANTSKIYKAVISKKKKAAKRKESKKCRSSFTQPTGWINLACNLTWADCDFFPCITRQQTGLYFFPQMPFWINKSISCNTSRTNTGSEPGGHPSALRLVGTGTTKYEVELNTQPPYQLLSHPGCRSLLMYS